eukprot:Skav203582  [mRNA]  locus=scaffold935:114446:115439:+ [translate_table: standard]
MSGARAAVPKAAASGDVSVEQTMAEVCQSPLPIRPVTVRGRVHFVCGAQRDQSVIQELEEAEPDLTFPLCELDILASFQDVPPGGPLLVGLQMEIMDIGSLNGDQRVVRVRDLTQTSESPLGGRRVRLGVCRSCVVCRHEQVASQYLG